MAALRATRVGAVEILTLDRPARRNAINRELFDALIDATVRVDDDDECAAVVLTGADPAFCAGADLADAADAELVAERRLSGRNPVTALLDARTPVIGAINGACITGGLELALACDVLVASQRATFADTHLSLGMFPGWGGAALLPEAVGRRRAKELSLTGRVIGASEAASIGLVSSVVPHEHLIAAALEIADRIAAAPAAKVAAVLQVHDDGVGLGLRERMALERNVRDQLPVDTSGAAGQLQALRSR
jgi:enoyl-CoA hydratase/carnithine racemase